MYEVILKPAAVRDLDQMRRYDATTVVDAIEAHLARAPTAESKTRIKKLRGIRDPDYRLRVGDFRVFYNVDEEEGRVEVLRVIHKNQTQQYYQEVNGQ